MKIENTTSKALLISHPATWGHIYTSLKQRELKGKTSEIQIRIANAIKIKEYETLKIKVGALNDSYYLPGSSYSLGSHQLGKNNIYVKYYYEPKKIVRKRKMLLVTSVTEKFVISDVFTFYVCEKDYSPNLLRHIRPE